jgi:adenosylcobinamide kinase/adenosylcobinamide-phosphate guanylyltransferase
VTLRRVLVLGGARSGKSAFAQRLAAECGEPVVYVATATALDAEMAERIARHRADRPPGWHTVEVRCDLVSAAEGARTVLVEDLTLLLSNLFEVDASVAEQRAIAEVTALVKVPANLVLVTNEVGMDVVPANPLARAFRDAMGRVNQAAAAACSEVHLIVAGLPLRLK